MGRALNPASLPLGITVAAIQRRWSRGLKMQPPLLANEEGVMEALRGLVGGGKD